MDTGWLPPGWYVYHSKSAAGGRARVLTRRHAPGFRPGSACPLPPGKPRSRDVFPRRPVDSRVAPPRQWPAIMSASCCREYPRVDADGLPAGALWRPHLAWRRHRVAFLGCLRVTRCRSGKVESNQAAWHGKAMCFPVSVASIQVGQWGTDATGPGCMDRDRALCHHACSGDINAGTYLDRTDIKASNWNGAGGQHR